MIPMLQGRQDRHVVGLKHVEPRREHIRQLPFVDKDRRLPLSHGQLGPVFDLMPFTLKAPDHRVPAVIHPVDDVDKLTREEIEDGHG